MNVAIVKYNAGNIYSVANALKRLGITPELTDDAERLSKADRVLFPGQGEAGSTMAYLRSRGLDRLIRDLKQPVLGICIGQQLMCGHSEESDTDCLGIFDTEVLKFRPEKQCPTWDGTPWHVQAARCSKASARTNSFISYTAITCRSTRTP